jgi:hypothetical protein
MGDDLELQFHKDMLNIYKTAKAELKYNASRFLQLITSPKESIRVAKRFALDPNVTDGFTVLLERNRLDLTVEAHVILEKYQALFSQEEIHAAREKLKALGYQC